MTRGLDGEAMSMGTVVEDIAGRLSAILPGGEADAGDDTMFSYSYLNRGARLLEIVPQKQFKIEFYKDGEFVRHVHCIVAQNTAESMAPLIAEFLRAKD